MSARNDRDIPKARINWPSIKRSLRLFSLIRKSDRWLFGIGTIFLALTAVTSLLFPALLGKLVDARTNVNQLKTLAIYFVYLFIAQAVFSFLRIGLYVRVTENLTFALRKKLYGSVLLQNMDFFHQNRVGDLLSRLTADIGQIQDTFSTNLAMFLRQVLVIFGGIAWLFITSQKLALYMLISVPVVIVISLFFGRYIRKVSRQVQELTGNNSVIAEETFTGIQNVKAFSNETYELNRFGADVENLRRQSIFRGLLRGAFSSFIIICLFGSIVWLIFMGLGMVRTGEMEIGELFSFIMFTGFVGGSIGGLAEQFVQIQKTIGAVDRVLELIDKPTEPLMHAGEPKEKLQGDVAFEHVAFHYPSRPGFEVLKDIDFRVPSGSTLAVVGPSGAGKSTLVNLLYRFYEPVSGRICIGGEDIANADLFTLRNSMALVPQEIILFGGSIYENILYGNPQATEAQVEQAACNANAHDFIMAFPEGYKTVVGDRGIKLSGGQRQRIAIARAMLKDPRLLILDEATSSLDSESEQQVQEALQHLMEGRTSIVIAHRLSTIRNADQIIVLQGGHIAEQGSHEALMARSSGIYRRMVERQQEPGDFWGDDTPASENA
ncbi:MAG: ABC transporter ATP-binding protein [Bacteroidetes bacterium]|nr:ABC transporter ATP-binding protein [Bacteroidota bacterium]